MSHVVYALTCSNDSAWRYVGITRNPASRLASHLTAAGSGKDRTRKADWIRAELAAGRTPAMVLVADDLTLEAACELECELIAKHRQQLTNTASGGQTGPVRLNQHERWLYRNLYYSRREADALARLMLAGERARALDLIRALREARRGLPSGHLTDEVVLLYGLGALPPDRATPDLVAAFGEAVAA